LASSFLERFGS